MMNDYKYTQVDFDNPSFLFVLEDMLKGLLGCRLLYKPYIKSFGLKGDENILDFGCGGGTGSKCILNFLNENGYLTCIDTSSYWMRRAEKRLSKYPNVGCKLGDIRELHIPDCSYDVITIMHVIHDIEPVKRQDTVNALSQKLKKNGSLFIREPIKRSHGMAVEEIQTLLANANLLETVQQQNESEYKGKFIKNE